MCRVWDLKFRVCWWFIDLGLGRVLVGSEVKGEVWGVGFHVWGLRGHEVGGSPKLTGSTFLQQRATAGTAE